MFVSTICHWAIQSLVPDHSGSIGHYTGHPYPHTHVGSHCRLGLKFIHTLVGLSQVLHHYCLSTSYSITGYRWKCFVVGLVSKFLFLKPAEQLPAQKILKCERLQSLTNFISLYSMRCVNCLTMGFLCPSISLGYLGIYTSANNSKDITHSHHCKPFLVKKFSQFSLWFSITRSPHLDHPCRFLEVSSVLGSHQSPNIQPSSSCLFLYSLLPFIPSQ